MKRKHRPLASSHSPESGRVTRVRPEQYEVQLQEKIQFVQELFQDIEHPEMQIFRSPDQHYRQRCEFRVYHEGDACYYVMFERENETDQKLTPKRIDSFPAASVLINRLMSGLMDRIDPCPLLKHHLYTAAFHTTLSQQSIITLVYHKRLGDDWRQAAETLAMELQNESALEQSVNIIGRSRKQKLIVGRDYVTERLTVNGQIYTYKQVEGCFSQPNGDICSSMLTWAQEISTPRESSSREDLLELYCGNCNFTIPLSKNFRKVIATEFSRASVQAGHENLEQNAITNVLLARMSSEEFVKKWQSGDLGRRLQNHKASDFKLSTIFVDPPRAGLDIGTIEHVLCCHHRCVCVRAVIEAIQAHPLHLMQSLNPPFEHYGIEGHT